MMSHIVSSLELLAVQINSLLLVSSMDRLIDSKRPDCQQQQSKLDGSRSLRMTGIILLIGIIFPALVLERN
jgi:hypothetical protein